MPSFKYLSEYIWISGFSIFTGFKTISISNKEYRFLVNNMLFQLDSESVFEMMEQFPEFVLGTSIRGEGKMACPVLFNLVKLQDTRGFGREHIKDFIRLRSELTKRASQKGTGPNVHSSALRSNETRKERVSDQSVELRGTLKFVMGYVHRYQQIKILEEDGPKAVGKMRRFVEEDSEMVISNATGSRFYLINEMEKLEQSLLQKRGSQTSPQSRLEPEAADPIENDRNVTSQTDPVSGFAVYGGEYAFSGAQSKDERDLNCRLRQDLETRRIREQRRQDQKLLKIKNAKLKLAQRKRERARVGG